MYELLWDHGEDLALLGSWRPGFLLQLLNMLLVVEWNSKMLPCGAGGAGWRFWECQRDKGVPGRADQGWRVRALAGWDVKNQGMAKLWDVCRHLWLQSTGLKYWCLCMYFWGKKSGRQAVIHVGPLLVPVCLGANEAGGSGRAERCHLAFVATG